MHRDTPVFPCFTKLFLETKQTNYIKDPKTLTKMGTNRASSPPNTECYISKISWFVTGEDLK